MKEILVLNPENATPEEYTKYSIRKAVRAVVVNNEELIGLVHSVKNNHYKIPGGGIEDGESIPAALNRECLEEIGTDVEIISEIGYITEYRKMWGLTQISYCYFAKQKGRFGKPGYMQDEIEEGFEPIWLPYKEALESISLNRASSFEGKNYIVPRDTTFLRKAEIFLNKLNKFNSSP